MALVEREDVAAAMALGENDNGCVSQADAQPRIPTNDLLGSHHVSGIERLELKHAPTDFFEERALGGHPDPASQQVIQFREYERREQPGRRSSPELAGRYPMAVLAAVDCGQ